MLSHAFAGYSGEPCSGMRELGGKDGMTAGSHTFARVFGEGARSMVLPTVRPVSGAGVRCKGGAGAFEDRVPRGAVAPTPVQQETTGIRRFREAARGLLRLGFEKLDVASCAPEQACV